MGSIVDGDGVPGGDERLELRVAEMRPGAAYPWLTATVVPRPIAWVSSVSPAGELNLAPHSFFTVASAQPPVVQFTSVGHKDSLHNVRDTGEFVVCLSPRALTREINATSTGFAREHSEWEAAGVRPEPSTAVRPPRVADSPVALECRYAGEHSFGTSVVVFGEVVLIAVRRSVIAADGLPDPQLLDPVSRLGRDQWSTLGTVFSLRRIPVDEFDSISPEQRRGTVV